MTCPKCHGELFPDRISVLDLAAYGYIGARWRCVQGCHDQWIKERAAGQAPAPEVKKVTVIQCVDCHANVRTRHRGVKRCDRCRRDNALAVGRLSWKRYQAGVKVPA